MTPQSAYRAVRTALDKGLIVRPSVCELCKATDTKAISGRHTIQAHHYLGYDYPLEVKWLCAACHRRETPLPAPGKSGGQINPALGVRNGQAKLNDELVRFIRKSPLSTRKLGAEINVDRKTISRVRSGKQWSHIQ